MRAGPGPLEFVHPVARAAIYGDLPPGERARLHAAAARMIAEEDAAAERVAAHLLVTEPSGDGWTVARLRAAARDAMAHGAPPAGIAYLQRAIAEPPEADELRSVLHEPGDAEAADARSAQSMQHLRRAGQLSPTPVEHACVASTWRA